MTLQSTLLRLVCLLVAVSGLGCRSKPEFRFDPSIDNYQPIATQIEVPAAQENEANPVVLASTGPVSLRRMENLKPWRMTLQEAIRLALANSQVIRDVGGRIVSAPATAPTVMDPALSDADPNRGVEAALAAFDAQFSTSLLIGMDERSFNNAFFGGGATGLQTNDADFRLEVSKTAATGTQFFLRNQTLYNRNTSPVNLFPSAYDTLFEAEFRHPLLQGSGIAFNRIAGPNARPGQYNGVLLARINTDIALADFEQSIRGLLFDVERTYWDLYFAYRDLQAKIARRDATLRTWREVQDKLEIGSSDGEREAFAREQYYSAKAQAENSLSGQATSAGGVPITTGGVFALERRLRRLLGLPTRDGRVIKPADEPVQADVAFDWNEAVAQAMWRRAELRRQKWVIKQRELQLLASQNFLQMRLDLVALYRWRGFGDELLGNQGVPNGSAFADLFTGDLQGWRYGLQLSTPIGNRQAHAGVRHAELTLAREKAVLREQEVQVTHDLADAFAELDRAHQVARTNFNRAVAANQQVGPIRAKYEEGAKDVTLEDVLESEARAAEAKSAYFRSLVEFNMAIAAVHVSKGTFLDYHKVRLAEGPWSAEDHRSALKQARRFRPGLTNYCLELPHQVSLAPFDQDPGQSAAPTEEVRERSEVERRQPEEVSPGPGQPETSPQSPGP